MAKSSDSYWIHSPSHLKRNKMKYNCTDWTAIARGRYIAGLGEVADETSCSPAADLSPRGAAWTWTRDAPLPSCVRGAHGGRRRLVLAVQRLLSSTRARRPVSRRSPSSPLTRARSLQSPPASCPRGAAPLPLDAREESAGV